VQLDYLELTNKMPEGRSAMQLRWHDPQPMAMLQHGGRIKMGEAPPLVPEHQAGDSQEAGHEKHSATQEFRLQSS
jgi:hypothetical protein